MKKIFFCLTGFLLAWVMPGCVEELKKAAIEADEIYTNRKEIRIMVGETVSVSASLGLEDFGWVSNNTSVASVTPDGTVEGIAPGETQVVVSSGALKKSVDVTVGSRLPSTATKFGNGLLLRWDTKSSALLVRTDLHYLDADSVRKVFRVLPSDKVTLVPDYHTGLRVSGIFCHPGRTDTMRVEPAMFSVRDVSSSVQGTAATTVDARHFDCGPGGWYDSDPTENRMGYDYRGELGDLGCGVDIGLEGEVGAIAVGEWLQYTLRVMDEGLYLFDINLANSAVAGIDLIINDQTVESLTLAGSGNNSYRYYYATRPREQPVLKLAPGTYRFRILFTGGSPSFRSLRIFPRTVFGGLMPDLQYTFDFPSDYTRPTIGDLHLVFADGSGPVNPATVVKPSPVAPEGVSAVTGAQVRVPVPFQGILNKYTVQADVYFASIGNVELIHASNWGDKFYTAIWPGTSALAPGKWMRVVFAVDLSDPANRIKKVYVNGTLHMENNDGLRAVSDYFIIRAEHIAGAAVWVNQCLDAGQVGSLGAMAQTREPFGAYRAVRMNNGLMVTFLDRWNVPYRLDYTDSRSMPASVDVPVSSTRSWVMLPDFDRGLKSSVEGGAGISFADSKIIDRRSFVSSGGTTTIEAVNFDVGGEGVAFHCNATAMNETHRYRTQTLGETDCPVNIEGNTVNPTGYTTGSMLAGEWLQYTVLVGEEADYYLDVNVSTSNNAQYSLRVNGVEGSAVTYRNNGVFHWYYETNLDVLRPRVRLKVGYNTIRYTVRRSGAKLNAIKLFRNLPPAQGVAKATKFGNGMVVNMPDNLVYKYTLRYTDVNGQPAEVTPSPSRKDTTLYDFKTGLSAYSNQSGELLPFPDGSIVDKAPVIGSSGRLILPIVDFDLGGEGVGYHDSNSTRDGAVNYRGDLGEENCAVDIHQNPPTIAWITPGEWWKFTIDVAQAGEYLFDVLVGITGNRIYNLNLNGTDAGDFTIVAWIGNTSSFKWYYDSNPGLPQPRLQLNAGKNTLIFKASDANGTMDIVGLKFLKTPYPAVTAGVTDSRVAGLSPTLYYGFTNPADPTQPDIGSAPLELLQNPHSGVNPGQDPIKFSYRPEWNPAPGRNAVIVGRNDHIKVINPVAGSSAANPLNRYTLMWDVVRPSSSWYAFLQTYDLDRNEDASLFIRRQGGIGRSRYSDPTYVVSANVWHRVVLVIDVTDVNSKIYKVYVDGALVLNNDNASALNGVPMKEHFWIFTDGIVGTRPGEEDDLYCAGFAMWADIALTEAQIASLGSVVP